VDIFASSVIAQDQAKTAKEGNKHARKLIKAYDELAEIGDEGRDALMILFKHEYPRIHCMAAVFLLRHNNRKAMAVLRDLALGEDFVSFCARQSIKNLKEGCWDLDPKPIKKKTSKKRSHDRH
jgi:hypothetical protein